MQTGDGWNISDPFATASDRLWRCSCWTMKLGCEVNSILNFINKLDEHWMMSLSAASMNEHIFRRSMHFKRTYIYIVVLWKSYWSSSRLPLSTTSTPTSILHPHCTSNQTQHVYHHFTSEIYIMNSNCLFHSLQKHNKIKNSLAQEYQPGFFPWIFLKRFDVLCSQHRLRLRFVFLLHLLCHCLELPRVAIETEK